MVDRTGLFVAPVPGQTPAGTSATDGRLVLGAAFGTTGGCLSGGVMTASSTAMQVTLGQSVWRIPDPTNTAGVYLSPADAATLTFSAGPASGSRIDVIYVRQNNYEAGDANSRVVYGVAIGTAAATPAAPAIPAGAMKIGQLTVLTGVSNAAACTLVPSYSADGKVAADSYSGITFNSSSGNLDGTRITRISKTGNTAVLTLALNVGGTAPTVGGTTIFTVPAGYRPPSQIQLVCGVYGTSGYVGFAIVAIASDGTAVIQYSPGGMGANYQLTGTASWTTV